MRNYALLNMRPINEVDPVKVQRLADDIATNGWIGMPILYSEDYGILITGSHRLEALKALDDNGCDLEDLGEIAENVDDLIVDWADRTGNTVDDIDYSRLRDIFEGTRIEQYKDQFEW